MPSLFSRLKGRDGKLKSKKGALDELANQQPQKPKWEDAWARKTVEPEEVQQLIRFSTEELKARGMTSKSGLCCARPAHEYAPQRRRPVPQQQANGTLQLSISRSSCSLSGQPPIQVLCVLLCDTSSMVKMAVRRFAGRHWPRNCE